MNKELLVSKWLDNALSPEELAQFKQLPEYEDYVRLSEYAPVFKAPKFDADICFQKIENRKTKRNTSWRWLKIAAAIAIIVSGAYAILQHNKTTLISTEIGQQETITLPDNSVVVLNAASTVSFSKDDWQENRSVHLDGEAFFKVAKGATFTVLTSQGNVNVLGTEFNVQERDNLFSVATFEGLVYVNSDRYSGELSAGKSIYTYNDELLERNFNSGTDGPTWIEKISTFDSAPFSAVVAEMERQYDITIHMTQVQKDTLYTGSFTHTDLDQALRMITIPMGLTFSQEGALVTLAQE